MNTRGAKAKGRSLQNRIAKDLARVTGLRYGSPNDDLADLRGRLMGTSGEDLVRSLRARLKVPFFIESKNSESWSFGSRIFGDGLGQLLRWYFGTCDRATKSERIEYNIPIVVAAKAHFPPVVVISNDGDWYSSFWNLQKEGDFDSVISVQVPVARFLDRDRGRYFSTSLKPDAQVDILAWEDFLWLWYGERK
jgi:hypothetical protein